MSTLILTVGTFRSAGRPLGSPVGLNTNAVAADGSSANVVAADHVHPVTVHSEDVANAGPSTTGATGYTTLESIASVAPGTWLALAGVDLKTPVGVDEEASIALFQDSTQIVGSERATEMATVAATQKRYALQTHALITIAGFPDTISLRWKTAGGNTISAEDRNLTLVQLSL